MNYSCAKPFILLINVGYNLKLKIPIYTRILTGMEPIGVIIFSIIIVGEKNVYL